jgi:hypothetical protein
MLKEVSADVRRATNNAQRPQQLSDMSRTFYFAAAAPVVVSDASAPEQVAKAPIPAAAPVVPTDDRAFDVAFWNAAQAANDCDAVRAYLQRFPNGVFVELGKLSERRLCGPQRKVTVAESVDRPETALTPVVPGSPALAAPNSDPKVQVGVAKMAALSEPVNAGPSAARTTGPNTADLARIVQLELYRLGCGPSNADGKWNSATREGLRRFNRAIRVKLELDSPSDATITALQKQSGRVCPLECGRGMQARGDSCVAIKIDPPKTRKVEKTRHVERTPRRHHMPVEVSGPPPSAPHPMMMGPMGGGFGGGMMFFGMGRRH